MTHHRLLCSIVLAVASLVNPMLGSTATGQTANRFTPNTVTLGVVAASHQREIEEHFRPFVTYIARQLFSTVDAEGKIIVVPTLPELAQLLDQKKVDFFMESPYPTYVVNQVHGAGKLLLRRWKSGLAEYRGLIATSNDSGVNRLESLRGKVIAFEDPESTSGYFLPKFFLQRNGFKLSQVAAPDANVPATEIGYVFARDTARLVELILTQQVVAGTISDDDFASLDEKRKAALNILAQTELLPRHLVSVRKDLDAGSCERLALVLQSMHENDQGRKILLDTDNTTKFDVLPGGEEVMRRRLLDTFYAPGRK
jgi:ABC-type phosphate/phosphonate transport system substrate-binding protein